jgi:hypothetical protein
LQRSPGSTANCIGQRAPLATNQRCWCCLSGGHRPGLHRRRKGDFRASIVNVRGRISGHGSWTPNDGKHLLAGATNHDPVPINGCLDDLKLGRDRVYHKVRMPRGRAGILRDCRLSAAAAFRAVESQGNSGLGGHWRSMGRWPALTPSKFCSQCPKFVLGGRCISGQGSGEGCWRAVPWLSRGEGDWLRGRRRAYLCFQNPAYFAMIQVDLAAAGGMSTRG